MLGQEVSGLGKMISYNHIFTTPIVFGLLLFIYNQKTKLIYFFLFYLLFPLDYGLLLTTITNGL